MSQPTCPDRRQPLRHKQLAGRLLAPAKFAGNRSRSTLTAEPLRPAHLGCRRSSRHIPLLPKRSIWQALGPRWVVLSTHRRLREITTDNISLAISQVMRTRPRHLIGTRSQASQGRFSTSPKLGTPRRTAPLPNHRMLRRLLRSTESTVALQGVGRQGARALGPRRAISSRADGHLSRQRRRKHLRHSKPGQRTLRPPRQSLPRPCSHGHQHRRRHKLTTCPCETKGRRPCMDQAALGCRLISNQCRHAIRRRYHEPPNRARRPASRIPDTHLRPAQAQARDLFGTPGICKVEAIRRWVMMHADRPRRRALDILHRTHATSNCGTRETLVTLEIPATPETLAIQEI